MKKAIAAFGYYSKRQIIIDSHHALLERCGLKYGDTVHCSQCLRKGVVVGVGKLPDSDIDAIWCIFEEVSEKEVFSCRAKDLVYLE